MGPRGAMTIRSPRGALKPPAQARRSVRPWQQSDRDPPAPDGAEGRPSPFYVLRVATADATNQLALAEGLTLIGRAADCTVVLDHPLASRHHAALRVEGARVQLRDLASRNGCLVNGEPIDGAAELGPGDQFRIADTDFELLTSNREPRVDQRSELRRAQTITMSTVCIEVKESIPGGEATAAHPLDRGTTAIPAEAEEATRQAHFFELIGPVVDKALALGRPEEAARLLSAQLERLAERSSRGSRPSREVADLAADFAARLAEATQEPRWLALALQLFIAERRPLPLPVIDRLFGVLRRMPGAHRSAFEEYLRVLQARKDTFSPAERFALQRLESLARLTAR